MAKNYYDILGVSKSASKDEIKKAFRKLAHEHHPDKKTGNADKFKEANEAYSILSDDTKRQQYDTYGQTFNGAGSAGAGGFGQGGGFGGFDFSGFQQGQGFGNGDVEFDLGDIFGDFFGGGGRRQQAKRGRDISVDIEIPFKDSIFGVERKIVLNKTSTCDHCKGSGGEPGTKTKTCPTCNGTGSVRENRRSILGTFTTEKVCDTCHGKGSIPEEKCRTCRGAGVYKHQSEISVKIPAGVNGGETLRMTGAGEAVSGGNAGDLYMKIHVKPHPIFRKDGHNIVTDLKVKLSDALLGKEYSIETLDGLISVKIPAGVTFGEILRVKGKGVPVGSSRGDLLIIINIELPKKLSKEGKRLIEELKKEGI